jgi:hypothetical protein
MARVRYNLERVIIYGRYVKKKKKFIRNTQEKISQETAGRKVKVQSVCALNTPYLHIRPLDSFLRFDIPRKNIRSTSQSNRYYVLEHRLWGVRGDSAWSGVTLPLNSYQQGAGSP